MASLNAEMKAGRLSACAFFLFAFLAVCLFRMQILKGDYYRGLSEKNRLRLVYLEGARGKILDRRGRTLVTSRLSFNCSAFAHESKTRITQTIERLAPLLGEPPLDIFRRYQKRKAGIYNTVVLAEDIPSEKAMAIEEQLYQLPGVMVETHPVREYPLGEAASCVTGFIGPQTTEEAEELEEKGYRPVDWIGREGLEKYYESDLRGHSGGLQLEVDSRGQYVQVLGVQEPAVGRNIQVTLDAELQDFTQKQLEGHRGALIVMELTQGGILAMNSSPSYDANLFSSVRGRRNVGKYLTAPHSPMMNRAIQSQVPCGSIFKIVTGLAALEARAITPQTVFSCPGFYLSGKKMFRCWKEKGHGPQNLSDAYAHSCDVFFYLTGLSVGGDLIQRKAVQFGFAAPTGIDLPGEKKGLVPSREWKQKSLNTSWFEGDTLNLSIGQGYLEVTPIQALGMIAVVATGGLRLKPHLLEKIEGVSAPRGVRSRVEADPKFLEAVKHGLEEVIHSDSGTGRAAKIPGVRVAGKTGTAETGGKKTHAWFVGYAPADDPKVALVVFLEHGGHGGVEAAGVARAVLEKLKEKNYL